MTKPHVWTCRIVGIAFCCHCGLFWLNNEATRREARRPCPVR